ncbi:MAG TPA: hypothetical protein VGP91_16930 [Actinoplanes sp.]|jgi:hypothetical protein|nr:hypothetical protein [Actinoplanes sp.]
MNPDLEVDAHEMRAGASALAGTAARVTSGAAEAPATVAVPRWAASDVAALAADATRGLLAETGADIAATARQIVAAVVDYEDADDRAASRLQAVA